ncbi:MAG: hypothetical protein K0T53_04245, partial [Wolbachia pipientis]|nr:hypothetical protein [Wolbachia pipientis]
IISFLLLNECGINQNYCKLLQVCLWYKYKLVVLSPISSLSVTLPLIDDGSSSVSVSSFLIFIYGSKY